MQDLLSLMRDIWLEHENECSVCVSWGVFQSAEDAVVSLELRLLDADAVSASLLYCVITLFLSPIQGLVDCLGTQLLADMCERFARNYRFCRSGLPDLTMWNAQTKKYKVSKK